MARAFLKVHNLKVLNSVELANGAWLLSGENDPGESMTTEEAPIGSTFSHSVSGKMWIKRTTGSGKDKWIDISIDPSEAKPRIWGGIFQPSSGTTVIPSSTTSPLVTAGTQLLSHTITPRSVNSKFLITANFTMSSNSTSAIVTLAVFRNNTFIGDVCENSKTANGFTNMAIAVLDSPESTDDITYEMRFGSASQAATWYINRRSVMAHDGMKTGWQIQEY